jgi:hypothetical protein
MVCAQTAPEELSSDQFEDPLRCQVCHAEIYKQWEGSMHSQAELDPYYLAQSIMASEETDGLTDTYCARCHTPIGVVSGEVPPVDGSNLSEIAKKGVQCDFCHTVTEIDGTANAKFTLTPDGTKQGPFDDSLSPAHNTGYSELHTTAEFCGMCHDVNHPTNGLPLEATYTEWKNGPYAAQGIQCQDCHMTPGITGYQANPGKASGIGGNREHIWTHFSVGGNVFMTEYLGSKTHADMAVDRLQRAAQVNVIPSGFVESGESFSFDVLIKNIGAGHYLPTGVTESRQMWLDITVTDGAGTEVYRSGALDEHGNIDPEAVVYHTILADAGGHPTEKVWEAESILSDHRIPPKGEETESHGFTMPEDVSLPISITAVLKYRSAPQEFIDHLLGGEFEVPVVEMTQDSKTIGDEDKSIPGFQVPLPVMLGLLLLLFCRRGNKK